MRSHEGNPHCIQNGEFAKEFVADCKNGHKWLFEQREAINNHEIEKTGAKIRDMFLLGQERRRVRTTRIKKKGAERPFLFAVMVRAGLTSLCGAGAFAGSLFDDGVQNRTCDANHDACDERAAE